MEELSERSAERKTRRWRSTLDTDIDDFCKKEGIPMWDSEKGKGNLNEIGFILCELYDDKNIRTIKELIAMTKTEFLDGGKYYTFYGERKKAEECWKTMNNILKRHGFRMYVKGRTVYY